MKKYPEEDIQKLTDQLKEVLAWEKPRSKENCTNCGRPGHSDFNCFGDGPARGEQGHSPGTCQLSPEKIRAREKRWAENKKIKLKLQKTQSKQNLPEGESSGRFWAESLSDGETVIDTNQAEERLEESCEDETSEEVKRVREVIGDASNKDIISYR